MFKVGDVVRYKTDEELGYVQRYIRDHLLITDVTLHRVFVTVITPGHLQLNQPWEILPGNVRHLVLVKPFFTTNYKRDKVSFKWGMNG